MTRGREAANTKMLVPRNGGCEFIGSSFNGRTGAFGTLNPGSNPGDPATRVVIQRLESVRSHNEDVVGSSPPRPLQDSDVIMQIQQAELASGNKRMVCLATSRSASESRHRDLACKERYPLASFEAVRSDRPRGDTNVSGRSEE